MERLIALISTFALVVSIAFYGGLAYIAYHFISKLW